MIFIHFLACNFVVLWCEAILLCKPESIGRLGRRGRCFSSVHDLGCGESEALSPWQVSQAIMIASIRKSPVFWTRPCWQPHSFWSKLGPWGQFLLHKYAYVGHSWNICSAVCPLISCMAIHPHSLHVHEIYQSNFLIDQINDLLVAVVLGIWCHDEELYFWVLRIMGNKIDCA